MTDICVEPKYDVPLFQSEVLALDGACNTDAQVVVDRLKRMVTIGAEHSGLTPKQTALIVAACEEARKTMILTFRHTSIDFCSICGRNDGYWPYSRSSRYHRKGQPDYSRHKVFPGVELAERFITIKNHVSIGGCNDCVLACLSALRNNLTAIPCQLPDQLYKSGPRYKRYSKVKCTVCNWQGHEGELGKLPALMGGEYPGECPSCHAKNLPFGRSQIQTTSEYVCVEQRPRADAPEG